ncbi:hypothetical protein mEp010_15 [Escherichia phage mEp010]
MALFDQPRSTKTQNNPQNKLASEINRMWCYTCLPFCD